MDIQAYIQSGIIESYVLGLANSEEIAELEKLSVEFPEIRQAIAEFSASVEKHALTDAITPPVDVKSKIMAAIKGETASAPVVSMPVHTATPAGVPVKRFRIISMLAAASVILFIASAGLNFYLYGRYKQRNNEYQALLTERNSLFANNQVYQTQLRQWESVAEMMADPSMSVIKMQGTPGRESNLATIFWNTKNKNVYIMPNKLPSPAKGKQFQLWALVNGKPVDAGVLDPSCQGVCQMKNIPQAEAFAITLENEGGSPTPTMNEMYVMGKV